MDRWAVKIVESRSTEPNFAKQGQRVIGWIIVVFLAIIGLLYAIGVLPR